MSSKGIFITNSFIRQKKYLLTGQILGRSVGKKEVTYVVERLEYRSRYSMFDRYAIDSSVLQRSAEFP